MTEDEYEDRLSNSNPYDDGSPLEDSVGELPDPNDPPDDPELLAKVNAEIAKDEAQEKLLIKEHEESIMSFPLTAALKIAPLSFHKNQDNELLPILAVEMAAQIVERLPIAKTPNNTLYYYLNGVYVSNGIGAIKELVLQLMKYANMGKYWEAEYVGSVIEAITVECPLLWEKPLDTRINVLNGLFDTKTKKLLPHSPKYLSTVQLPIEYNEFAKCPRMIRFIGEVFPMDSIHIAWQLMAWVISSYSKTQKMVILDGSGSNGKSTFLAAIENLLGKANVSHVSLQRLEADRFAPARLYQKLANICADLPKEKLKSTSIFKSITGGDPVEIEYKNKNSYPAKLFTKLLFSTNGLPRSSDVSDGFYRKIDIIPFDADFPPNPAKAEQLEKMISDPEELSGMFNMAVAQLDTVRQHGIKATPSMIACNEDYRELTDPLPSWVDANVEYNHDFNTYVGKGNLYNKYKEDFQTVRGYELMSAIAFSKAFKKLWPGIKEDFVWLPGKDEHSKGKNVRVWLGIKIKDVVIPDLSNS